MKNAKKATVTITAALLAVAALTSTADATCGFSNPTESSSFAAGESMPISWTDVDGEGAKCADLTLTVELRVGTRDVQKTVATVASGVEGSAMGTSYDIPTELPQTDDTYFLEMHDAKNGFQNFSARFTITGVKSSGGDPTDPDTGKNGTDPDTDPDAGKGAGGDDPDAKGKSDNDTLDSKGASDTSSADADKNTDEKDDSPTTGKKGDSGSGTSNQPNGGSNAGDAPANNTNPSTNTEPNAASSRFVSFASLAIVTVAVALSNLF